MSYQYIFFDLDGTILESGQFLNDTLQYALDSIGRGYLATPRIKARFLGVPLREGLLDYCGLSEEETQAAVDAFLPIIFSTDRAPCSRFAASRRCCAA